MENLAYLCYWDREFCTIWLMQQIHFAKGYRLHKFGERYLRIFQEGKELNISLVWSDKVQSILYVILLRYSTPFRIKSKKVFPGLMPFPYFSLQYARNSFNVSKDVILCRIHNVSLKWASWQVTYSRLKRSICYKQLGLGSTDYNRITCWKAYGRSKHKLGIVLFCRKRQYPNTTLAAHTVNKIPSLFNALKR